MKWYFPHHIVHQIHANVEYHQTYKMKIFLLLSKTTKMITGINYLSIFNPRNVDKLLECLFLLFFFFINDTC